MSGFIEFYPTPQSLISKALNLDWKFMGKCRNFSRILEPSAGKGDFADGVVRAFKENLYATPQVDVIEINPELRATLKGKGYPVIADDFLRFNTYKRYGLIVMNPPFSNGDEHLLHAIELQKNGGSIICILNAETIKNPYTLRRKELANKLEELNAEIQFLSCEFENAERKTDVEIALVRVTIPEKESDGFILHTMKKGMERKEKEYDATSLQVPDYIRAAIDQYNYEVEAGIKLMEEYNAMQPYLMDSLTSEYKYPILELKMGNHDLSVNGFVEAVRQKYWDALFRNPKFTGKMTSDQQSEYLSQVDQLKGYDFSYYNIKEMQIQMSRNMVRGIEECILKLFDEICLNHSWYPECTRNIHYYNGWATNKAYRVEKKVILPVNAFDYLFKEFRYRNFDYRGGISEVYDADKVFAYLGAKKKTFSSIGAILQEAEKNQDTKNIHCPYFDLTFYKKGTVHITFTDEEALKRFNIFGSQKKGWLPQEYGRKAYKDLDPSEKAVVDAFEENGETSYNSVVQNPDKYLYNPLNSVPRVCQVKCVN